MPTFLCYVLSFIYVGIYWNNHHHLFQAVDKINGRVLWANLHLLFWLSLMPFVSAWMGENHFAALPIAFYGAVLIFAAVAYYVLTLSLLAHHGKDSKLAKAIGSDFKGKISLVLYALGIALSFLNPWLGLLLYGIVALIWLLPDQRIEKTLKS